MYTFIQSFICKLEGMADDDYDDDDMETRVML